MSSRNVRQTRSTSAAGYRSLLIAIAIAIVAQSTTQAWADIVTLQSGASPVDTYRTQDAHIRNDNLSKTDNNTRIVFGSLVGTPGDGKSLRGLYSYPLTGIPSGATINSVTFHVVQVDNDAPASTAGPVSVELHSISETFFQGTGVLDPPDGSSWSNTFGATMTLGSTALTSAMMDAKPATLPVTGTPSTWIDTTFASSASLVAAVQTQLNAGQPFNFALVLPTSLETSGERRIFRTTSNTEVSTGLANRPRLIIDYTALAAGLPGDYDGNNQVDAADYILWRKNMGGAAAFSPGSRNPALGTSAVTNDDYDYWRAHFGNPAGTGATSLQLGAVPEPCASGMLLFGLAFQMCCLRRGRP